MEKKENIKKTILITCFATSFLLTGCGISFSTIPLETTPDSNAKLDYSNCVIKEIDTNYLLDFEYPSGIKVEDIKNWTGVHTKYFDFDKQKLHASKLLVAINDSIGESSYPNIEFFNQNKELLAKTSGSNYKKEPCTLVNDIYGLLKDIPDNTKFIRYSLNYLTRNWLRIFYLVGEPTYRIKEKSIFENENMLFFGDSIIGNFEDADFAGSSIPNTLSHLLNANVKNVGFGGCHMSDRNDDWNAYCMTTLTDSIIDNDYRIQQQTIEKNIKPSFAQIHLDTLKNTDYSSLKYMFIAYGINDFTSSKPLGELIKDENRNHSSYNKKTFIGATQYVVERFKEKYPNIDIILCSMARKFTPVKIIEVNRDTDLPKVGNINTIYFIKETFKSYVYKDNQYLEYVENGDKFFTDWENESHQYDKNIRISHYNSKLEELANYYHIHFIDNYNIGIDESNARLFYKLPDGTHPNQIGRNKIAYNIANNMKKFYIK